MSKQSLPVVGFPQGYPSGGADEVYEFQAATDQLFCCRVVRAGNRLQWPGRSAAFLPISWNDGHLPEWVADEGNRVFFDSEVPLVPEDTNGRQDVYEWEREGTGTCTAASAVNGGCHVPALGWYERSGLVVHRLERKRQRRVRRLACPPRAAGRQRSVQPVRRPCRWRAAGDGTAVYRHGLSGSAGARADVRDPGERDVRRRRQLPAAGGNEGGGEAEGERQAEARPGVAGRASSSATAVACASSAAGGARR